MDPHYCHNLNVAASSDFPSVAWGDKVLDVGRLVGAGDVDDG